MFEKSQGDGLLFIKLNTTKLDFSVAAKLKAQINTIAPELNQPVVLDFDKVTFMDSSGLAAVIFGFKVVGIGAKLSLCNVNPRLLTLFDYSGVSKTVPIYANRDAAAKAVTDRP